MNNYPTTNPEEILEKKGRAAHDSANGRRVSCSSNI